MRFRSACWPFGTKYGPEAIALGTGTGRHHIRWVSRFGHALGTPNWCEPGFAQCFHPRVNTSILTFGDFPVSDYTGEVPPACILFWGHNPVLSGPDGETRFNVMEALDHNPRTIVVDPRRTALAEKADLWLQIRPGADDALALAMLNVVIGEKLYDEPFVTQWTHGFAELAAHVQKFTPEWAEPITWIGADKIRAAARLFAQTKPALLDWGCAIEHTPKCIQTIRAVSMLPALTGNIDVPGGWVFGMHGLGRFPSLIENLTPEANAKRLGADRFKLLGGEGADLPAAHIPTLLQAMRTGKPYPVKAFLVFGNNTLTTYANTSAVYEALMKLDFMVCADLFMTPTAELADIVLPAASWPELDQLVGLPTVAANVVLAQQKSVQIGECKSDEEMFVALARRMKLPVCTEPVKDVLDAMLAGGGLDITFDELKQKGFIKVPFKYKKYLRRRLQDTDRQDRTLFDALRADGLCAAALLRRAAGKSDQHARDCSRFSAGAHDRRADLTSSSIRSTARSTSCARRIAIRWRKSIPQTAKRLGIVNGAWMWIETKRGKMRQKAKLTDGIDPRVIHVEHGWWFPEQAAPDYGVWTSNANLLTDNKPPYDPAMGTYQLRALLCRVAPADVPTVDTKKVGV